MLIIVALGTRFINGGDDVVWSAVAILTRFGPFWPITATVPMVTAIIIVAVAVASVIGLLITVVSWAMSACILLEPYFGLFGVSVLIGSHNHLANPLRWLVIELRAEVPMMESSDEGGDDLNFCDLGIEFLISEKRLM